MKTKSSYLTAAWFATALVGVFTSATTLRAAEKPDYKAIAERIVGQCAGVKEGDRVVIRGDLRDIDLVEEFALAVWKRGAEPIQILGREKSALRYFDEVPASRDAVPLALSLKLAEIETVEISIGGLEFPDLLGKVEPARLSATEKRYLAVVDARMSRGVRSVDVGNGLYPTEAIAKRYGVTREQLADIYWSGINVDYGKLQSTGSAVRAALAAAKEARVTHANGTDFKVQLQGRPVYVSDGVISAEDIAKGGPALQVWLPAGEVYVVPVAGTAEGKIVVDRLPFDAGEIVGATFTVKAGKLTAHTAQPGANYDRWKALYAAAPEGKNEFGFLDLGINPNVKVPAGSKLATWVPAGTVSIGFGTNLWAGGTNNTPWGTSMSLNGCTVTLDGKAIVEKGVLKTP